MAIATNEEALNTTGQTTDITKSNETVTDVAELKDTGTAEIATGTQVPTPDIGTDITTPTAADVSATSAIEGGIQTTQQAIKEAPIEAKDRLIEEGVQRDTQTAQTEEFAAKREDIITSTSDNIAQTEAQIQQLTQDRAVRDAEALTSVKDKEIAKANLVVEEQRLKNGIAETEAEQKIDIAKQQATWSFNKL